MAYFSQIKKVDKNWDMHIFEDAFLGCLGWGGMGLFIYYF